MNEFDYNPGPKKSLAKFGKYGENSFEEI